MMKKFHSFCSMISGKFYTFSYPRANYKGVREYREMRRCQFKYAIDLKACPIDKDIIAKDPNLKRCRWLVYFYDLDRGAERSFYWESMDGLREMTEAELTTHKEFNVIQYGRVQFETNDINAAQAFRDGRRGGALFGRMSPEWREPVAPELPRENQKVKTA